MPLILLKAPPPIISGGIVKEGMDLSSSEVDPGRPPPFITPHCFQCRLPVERFTIDYVSSPFFLPIQFTCHGRSGGMKVPYLDVLKAAKEGGTLWVFTERTYAKSRRK